MQETEKTLKSYRAILAQWESNIKNGKPYNAGATGSGRKSKDKKTDVTSIDIIEIKKRKEEELKRTLKEWILSMIKSGESKTLEFKETFSLDVKRCETDPSYKPIKETEIETSSLKDVVAFLNTDGGNLLIGVKNNGEIIGLEREFNLFHNSKTTDQKDAFSQYWRNRLENRIGTDYCHYIDANLIDIPEEDAVKTILLVECHRSNRPCFLDYSDRSTPKFAITDVFYERVNSSAVELKRRKLADYILEHFKKEKSIRKNQVQ